MIADINGTAAKHLAAELGAVAQQVDVADSASVAAMAEAANYLPLTKIDCARSMPLTFSLIEV